MISIVEKFRDLRIHGNKTLPSRGSQPEVRLLGIGYTGLAIAFMNAAAGFVISLIWLMWIRDLTWLDVIGDALSYGVTWGGWVGIAYYILPLFHILYFLIRHRKRPPRAILERFSTGQKVTTLLIISFFIVDILNNFYPWAHYVFHTHHLPIYPLLPYFEEWWKILSLTALLAVFLAPCFYFMFPRVEDKKPFSFESLLSKKTNLDKPKIFSLWIGRSTGTLSKLWHTSGMSSGINVVLNTEDASQNILVLGGIGSGKTTRMMQPLLNQLLDQDCGGLLFDVKGDVKKSALYLAKMTGRHVTLIGPHQQKMNLLDGLTPEVAASFLKSAFLMSGGVRLDGFWIDTATELCRNSLGVLSFLPSHYSLQGLYNYLFDEEIYETIQEEINPILVSLELKDQRILKTYLRYDQNIFSTFDEKVKSGVKATIAQALSPFNHPDLLDAFCETSVQPLNFQELLEGAIYLVDMPLSTWGLGAKVAYTFIKLRFFNLMQSRIHHSEWNQITPVFFMCDEYQELISANKDGLSDLNFWDKSRSTKTIGIISTQSVSSFYAALGDKDLSHAILQNFRQKICFRTEDQATMHMMDSLTGQARVQRKTVSESKGTSSTFGSFRSTNTDSKGASIVESREAVLDAPLFRNLSPNQAIALLSIQGYSMDDVLELKPVFIEQSPHNFSHVK